MRNPYIVLGVAPDATRDEIKTAFRSLAKAFHPDHHQDDFGAEERFAEINGAYQIIGTPQKRELFDGGLIDARGRRIPGVTRASAKNPFAAFTVDSAPVEPSQNAGPDDIAESIFGDAFQREAADDGARDTIDDPPGLDDVPLDGKPGRYEKGVRAKAPKGYAKPSFLDIALKPLRDFIGPREAFAPSSRDRLVDLFVDLEDIATGAERALELPDGTTVPVAIPAATADGCLFRLADAAAGDVVVRIRYRPHRHFRVAERDLHVDLAITLEQAVFGTSAAIPGLNGQQQVVVPAWSGSDKAIRIAGEGLPDEDGRRGDLVAEIRILLPKEPDARLIDLLRLGKGDLYV